ncbi:MAG TPA: DNRLRE domain-containing protein, partial [Mycobacteriales bacterium]
MNAIGPDYVLPLGDLQYEEGSTAEFDGSYAVTGWGSAKGISRPAAGNHEYRTAGATGYYGFFGSNAGDPAKGYYSYDITGPNGAFRWHMIVLNSECADLGGGSISAGCGAGSSQELWLKSDLAAHPNVCTLAYWHRPRFSSSSTTPSSTTYKAFWNDLYNAGADVVLAGHAHDYERFAPQTADGAADPARGLRQFVVGTGGRNFQSMGTRIANSVTSTNTAFGVLKMTLHATSYDWQFVPAAGYTYSDSGSGNCHSAGTSDTQPPTAPTNVTAVATSASQVNLSWTASSDDVGVKAYRIYRGANGSTPTELVTTTTNATTYVDTTVAAGTPYTYQVAALDAAGNVSPLSAPASVTTPNNADTTPPSAPTGLAAEEVSSTEIDLGWTASSDSGTGVSGYRVYRKASSESAFTLLATTVGNGPGQTSYADTTVRASTTYQYYVTAYDGANNESAPSATVTSTTPAGGSTSSFTFTATGDATIVAASPSANAGTSTSLTADNSPVTDFLLKFQVATTGCDSLSSATLRLTSNNGSSTGGDFYTTGPNWSESTVTWGNAPTRGTLVNSLGAVTSGAVANLEVTTGVTTLNGEVDFRVGSGNSDAAGYRSRESTTAASRPQLTVVCATSAPAPDTMAPTAPGNLSAVAVSSGEIDLAWTASSDNLGVTGYDVYRDGAKVGTVAETSQSYRDTTVAAGTTYTYTVRARDAAGNVSAPSAPASATTPAGGGGSPQTFTFTANADATIVAASPTANAGTSTSLTADNSPVSDFLLRFAVATPGCQTLSSATLRLSTNNGSATGGDFYTTSTGWSESTVTWGNAPARGTLLTSAGPVTSGTVASVNVTAGVSLASGEVNLRVGSPSSDAAGYRSRESSTAA